MSAQIVARSGDLPGYCRVEGYVVPNVGFDLWMPENWNSKFIEVGGGGDLGGFSSEMWHSCDGPLQKGYACVASDLGHKGSGGLWASNNLQALVDFGYRATHVTALAGKAIAAHYYAREPQHAYFEGCSTGGEEALVEAQRFPWDFEGIIADAPWINDSDSTLYMVWANRALTGKDGKSLLTRADTDLLHKAVLARCDADDGIMDGIISNPRGCKFDPAELLCRAGQNTQCLTGAQVQAVKKVYVGPVNSRGEKIYPGGAEFGSERHWVDDYMDLVTTDGQLSTADWSLIYFRYMVMPPRGPGWQPGDVDFDRDYQRFNSGTQESLLNAANPDLRRFKSAGGKLIITHGWDEVPSGPPANVIDYYETVTRTMGGRAATQSFARLFMVPGMDHCGGGNGPGAYVIDSLKYLEDWVEQGRAPDVLIGAHPKDKDLAHNPRVPLAPAAISFTRPVYPYPVWAKYLGKGDPNDAANFGPAER
jgi:feruloyl esterase